MVAAFREGGCAGTKASRHTDRNISDCDLSDRIFFYDPISLCARAAEPYKGQPYRDNVSLGPLMIPVRVMCAYYDLRRRRRLPRLRRDLHEGVPHARVEKRSLLHVWRSGSNHPL